MTKNEIKTTKDLVTDILYNFPDARNSDNILYLRVLQYLGAKRGINFNDMSVFSFFMRVSALDVPSIETVGRCRRKVVEEKPQLAGDSSVVQYRADNEQVFRDFAKGN